MREPRFIERDGSRTVFSKASVGDLRNAAAGLGKDFSTDGLLPPDSDFRRRYAAIILRERGL